MIFRRLKKRGQANRSRIAPQQEVEEGPSHFEVNQLFPLRQEMKMDLIDVTCIKDKVRNMQQPHDDALVVVLTLVGLNVYRILVDNGSRSTCFASML